MRKSHRTATSMRRVLALVAAVTLSGTLAGPAAATADDCDRQCMIDRARAVEQANALPRMSFYDVPPNLPPAPAGTLVRAEAAQGYQLDPGIRATRILYHSRSSKGRDVAGSGVVLTPAGDPPPGGWRVVADAHGGSGVGRGCAPSLMKDLQYGPHLQSFVRAGYAVVAIDYAGLGTDGRHEFLSKRAAANDIVNSLPAARTAVRGLGGEWVALGHSQGGHAALAVGELMTERERQGRPDRGYRGLAAIAPASDLTSLFTRTAQMPDMAGVVPMIVTGAAASGLPGFRPSQVLTPAAAARLDTLRTDCMNVIQASYSDLTGNALIRRGAERAIEPYLRQNGSGTLPISGPVLIQQGTADVLTTAPDTAGLVARLCRKGTTVEYRTYQGLDHTGVVLPSQPDTMSWIDARFAGHAAPSTCVR
ncbi:alpha/beta fold hydrolase [Streptomyces sp. JV176]|uniref:alpha/beta fold hydrolase n=1 Tax=Streptomyces sp. JV176 TaxID=858630 RepID=UPI002E77B05B|nr:alpha/beta fold hydrolase [Streptomyces sp. JV176]MEE1801125.1 alpha/beta fold hydrolase [Streptomyces sp. JV176]